MRSHSWCRLGYSKVVLGLVNLALFAFLIRWAVVNLRLDLLKTSFSRIPFSMIPGAVLLNLLALVMGGARTVLLIQRPFGTSFAVNVIGDGMNTAAPLRLGDFARLYYGNLFYSIPMARLLAATVATEFAEMLALIVLTATLLFSSSSQKMINAGTISPLLFMFLVGLAALILTRFRLRKVVRAIPRRLGLRKKAIEILVVLQRLPIPAILAVTALVWFFDVMVVHYVFTRSLAGVPFEALDSIAVLLILNLVNVLPSAPAGLGIFEAGIVLFLSDKFSVGFEHAIAVAFVFHLINCLPQLVIATGIILSRQKKAHV